MAVEKKFRVKARITPHANVAIPRAALPDPPPREITLICDGRQIRVRLITVRKRYVHYYVPSSVFDIVYRADECEVAL